MNPLEDKDSERGLSEHAEDLACLKDPDDDDHEQVRVALSSPEKKQLLSVDESKDKEDYHVNSEASANDDFAHAIDVLSAETGDAPSSPLSKKHGRPDSPTPVVLPHHQQQDSQSNSLNSADYKGETIQYLAGGLMLIHDGPPVEVIPGGWPEGWRQRIILRKAGSRSKNPRKDNYFYTPNKGYEMLGVKKAKLFLAKLKEFDGDEDKALESMTAPIV